MLKLIIALKTLSLTCHVDGIKMEKYIARMKFYTYVCSVRPWSERPNERQREMECEQGNREVNGGQTTKKNMLGKCTVLYIYVVYCMYATNYGILCTRSESTFNALQNILSWNVFLFNFICFHWTHGTTSTDGLLVILIEHWPVLVFNWIFVCIRCGRFVYVLRVLIERVQTFNNEIVCNQPNDIENVPKNTKNPEHTKNTTISQRSSSKSYKLCTCVCVHTH